jgi:CBS domain-containing protein
MKVAFELIPKEFLSETTFYDYKDPMADALTKVNKFGAVVVFKEGQYYGIVDDRSIAKQGTMKMPQNYPVGKFARSVPILDSSSDIKSAIQVFYDSSSKAIPFAHNNKIKGILKRTDILKSILSLHLLSSYKASDIMSTPVIAIDQEASLEKARNAMKENSVNRLVVMDKGKLFGIITFKGIMLSSMATRGRSPELSPKGRSHTSVAEFSQSDVYTIDQDADLDQSIRELIKNNTSSLLVMRKGKPVGMLSVRDILETIVKNSNVQKRNIVISGLDSNSKEYEEDITSSLEAFAEKVDKFRDVKVDYIALNIKDIKGVKSRQYEMKARIGLVHGGAISMNASGFNLERTLKILVDKLYKVIETKNDIVITGRKV